MNTMAIDATQVPTMQNAITQYIEEVNRHMNEIEADTLDNSSGFYGEQLTAINNYIDDTCKAIKSIVTYFDEFNEALGEVKDAYQAKAESITTGTVEQPTENKDDLITINRMS